MGRRSTPGIKARGRRRAPRSRAATIGAMASSPPTPQPSATYRLTEDQAALRDAVRVLADERIQPRAAEIDRTAEFPWDVKELLASHDILALPYPEAYGGL